MNTEHFSKHHDDTNKQQYNNQQNGKYHLDVTILKCISPNITWCPCVNWLQVFSIVVWPTFAQ